MGYRWERSHGHGGHDYHDCEAVRRIPRPNSTRLPSNGRFAKYGGILLVDITGQIRELIPLHRLNICSKIKVATQVMKETSRGSWAKHSGPATKSVGGICWGKLEQNQPIQKRSISMRDISWLSQKTGCTRQQLRDGSRFTWRTHSSGNTSLMSQQIPSAHHSVCFLGWDTAISSTKLNQSCRMSQCQTMPNHCEPAPAQRLVAQVPAKSSSPNLKWQLSGAGATKKMNTH